MNSRMVILAPLLRYMKNNKGSLLQYSHFYEIYHMIRHDYFICTPNSPYTGSYTVLYSVACNVHFVKFSCLNAGGVKKKRKRKKKVCQC